MHTHMDVYTDMQAYNMDMYTEMQAPTWAGTHICRHTHGHVHSYTGTLMNTNTHTHTVMYIDTQEPT